MIRRGHKFNARRTVVDGIAFASAAEAARYQELRLLERAGAIDDLQVQPRYPLVGQPARPGAEAMVVAEYVADFSYADEDGMRVTEDVKGYDTPLSRLKRKFFAACYGREVRVVRMASPKRKRAA